MSRVGQLPVKIEHIPSLCLNGIHQANHFIFYRLNLRADNYLQIMLIELYDACRVIVLQCLDIDKRHIFH